MLLASRLGCGGGGGQCSSHGVIALRSHTEIARCIAYLRAGCLSVCAVKRVLIGPVYRRTPACALGVPCFCRFASLLQRSKDQRQRIRLRQIPKHASVCARHGLRISVSPPPSVPSQRRAIALRVHLVYCICSNTPFLSLLLPSPLPDPMRVVRSRRTSATTGPRHTRRVKLNSSPRPLCLPPLLVPSQFPLPPSLTPLHPCIAAASVF